MAARTACIAGEEIHRQWDAGRIVGQRIGPRQTPLGTSGDVFLHQEDDVSFYLLSRHGRGMAKAAPRRINDRANLYALKDLGVEQVLAWGPGGAITHNIAIGDLAILSDLIDRTCQRQNTFFEDSPLGYLRQFPVFCPTLRRTVGQALHEMKLVYHGNAVAAVCEGPRLETPAEVRMLATLGAEIVTHAFAPEVFLARELQLCYAAVCYVVDYAETGSRHRPFTGTSLFGATSQKSEGERLAGVVGAMTEIARRLAMALPKAEKACECDRTMSEHIRRHDLPADWRRWLTP